MRKKYFALLLLALIHCAKIVIHQEGRIKGEIANWEIYGGNIQRTHVYAGTVTLPLKLAWQRKLDSAVGRTIIVVDSILYFGTLDGKVYAYHLRNGDKLGHKKFDFAATCAYHNHYLIIARRYGDDTLYNLKLENGEIKWRINAGDIASEPLVYENSIITTALYKHIDLYASNSGVKIWTYETPEQIRSSPALAHDRVVFGCDDGYVYAVDATRGKLLWKFKTNASVEATPTIDAENNAVFIGSADSYFYALNLKSGKLLWKFKAAGKILNGAAYYGRKVIFGSTDNNVYCLNSISGDLLWKFKAKSVISTSPLIVGDVVFFGSLDHYLYAVDLHNGELKWNYKTAGRIRTAPVAWGNYLIVASEDNYIYAFKSQLRQNAR